MTFKWPWQYNFPPFFTLQPTKQTRDKQLEAWSSLVLDYCQKYSLYSIELTEVAQSELFNNDNINRRLKISDIQQVLNYLDLSGHIEWEDKTKRRCKIYWRKPDEWGNLIYQWARSIGLLNTVVTFYEITQGEDSANECLIPLHRDHTIKEADTVIIFVNQHTNMHLIVVTRGKTFNTKYGSLRHEFLIGKSYGSRISTTAGYVYALHLYPFLYTKGLQRRTQILYTADISIAIMLLDLKPGSIVCEAGTGSGSLTYAIVSEICPGGHLYTQDIEESRLKSVYDDLTANKFQDCVTITCRNAYNEGFPVKNKCNSVFLDLPEPWRVIEFVKAAMNNSSECRIVSFSPCVEQVQRVCEQLRNCGFIQIQTVEVVQRKHKVFTATENVKLSDLAEDVSNCRSCTVSCVPFPLQQPTHTGYLSSATLLPLA